MKITFQVDGCHSLTISTDPPRDQSQGDQFVWIQLDRQPLPTIVGEGREQSYQQGPTEVLASFGMRCGEARTIASALMTAAQRAR